MQWFEQIFGTLLLLLILLHVFLTVLYERADAGILTHRVGQDVGSTV